MPLSSVLFAAAIIASAGSVSTGGPSGPDWQGLATFISAIGSLLGAGVAAYVAIRRKDSTEEMLLKMLEDQKQQDDEDEEPPKRRRKGRSR